MPIGFQNKWYARKYILSQLDEEHRLAEEDIIKFPRDELYKNEDFGNSMKDKVKILDIRLQNYDGNTTERVSRCNYMTSSDEDDYVESEEEKDDKNDVSFTEKVRKVFEKTEIATTISDARIPEPEPLTDHILSPKIPRFNPFLVTPRTTNNYELQKDSPLFQKDESSPKKISTKPMKNTPKKQAKISSFFSKKV